MQERQAKGFLGGEDIGSSALHEVRIMSLHISGKCHLSECSSLHIEPSRIFTRQKFQVEAEVQGIPGDGGGGGGGIEGIKKSSSNRSLPRSKQRRIFRQQFGELVARDENMRQGRERKENRKFIPSLILAYGGIHCRPRSAKQLLTTYHLTKWRERDGSGHCV